MIKIKKLIFFLIITFCFPFSAYSEINDSLFATVGDKVITRSDIVDEIKIILISTGQDFSEEKLAPLRAAAVKTLIKRTIKEIEINKYETLKFSKIDLEKEMKNLADNLGMDIDTLKNTFLTNEIEFSKVSNIMKTELLWNSLIFELYKDRITINKNEIEDQLKAFQENQVINEYLVSEIIINNVPKEQMENEINKIKNQIETEGFENTAVNFSISDTALKGGDLGWINENYIPPEYKSTILNTKPGGLLDPILLPGGILFLKVRDKRSLKKFANIEEAKKQLINSEKLKILNMYSLSHYDSLRRTITIKYY